MKIGMIQVATFLGQPKRNRRVLEHYIQQAKAQKADVLVFPETWNVGFFPGNIEEIVEDAERSEDLSWLKDTAKRNQIHLVGGSIAIREEDKIYNRLYVVNRLGEVIYHYDKIHLFSPGQEPHYFTPGSHAQCFEMEGIPCAAQICYDVRFPELARSSATSGAKVMFTPAQWPHPRSEHWRTLNRARSIENQMYVVAVNGCGKAGEVQSCGRTALYDPFGEILIEAQEEEGLFIAEIDPSKVDEVRSKIPVFSDRRPSLYERVNK